MSHEILLITADEAFGQLLRQSLEETGQYQVFVTCEADKAKSYLRNSRCNTIFLDPEGDAEGMQRLGHDLRTICPAARFVVIVEAGQAVRMDALEPEDYLSKPFYLPDLLETAGKLFPKENPKAVAQPENNASQALAWLSDVTRAAQHLTRMTLQSSAQAALITQNERLWAYAGQLSQAAAREVADVIARYWDYEEQSDLVRFVRLTSTDADHMLYATLLAPGVILVMVFDAETPFSTIRSQANQLVHSLALPLAENGDEQEEGPASIAAILADVPSPDPIAAKKKERERTDVPLAADAASLEETQASEKRSTILPSSNFSRESSPAVPVGAKLARSAQPVASKPEVALEDELAVTVKSKARKKTQEPAEEEELGETRPHLATESDSRPVTLEPVSPAVYSLQYACLLIPRFIHHHLTGDLSDRLNQWVSEICIAFGWRLEYISVRPEYLQWVVSVPPTTSPGYLMRVMRQQTSERIFADFPALARENPSGDFWAPGYLIMGGSQPPPAQVVKNFISQTRQRQGISQQLRR